MVQIRSLDRADRDQLLELRRACYTASPDFTMTGDECELGWSREDEDSILLGAFEENGRLIATMRGRVLYDREALAHQAVLATEMPALFPTCYLSRAATAHDRAGDGLNAILRLHFLRFALDHGLRSLSGMITERAVRSRTLRDLGYRFLGRATDDEGLIARTGPWCLVVLDLARDGERALARLEGRPFATKASARPRA